MKLFDAIRQIPDKIGQHYLNKKIGKSWGDHHQNKIGERLCKDYSDYIQHQQAKLKFKSICPVDLEDYDQKYRAALAQRLRQFGGIRGGESVLCLRLCGLCVLKRSGRETGFFSPPQTWRR